MQFKWKIINKKQLNNYYIDFTYTQPRKFTYIYKKTWFFQHAKILQQR